MLFGAPFPSLGALGAIPNFTLFAHNGEERFVIWLLVGRERRFRVPPATGCSNIFEREILALGRPFAAIRMPKTSLQLGQLSLPFGHDEPLFKPVPVEGLIGY